MMKIFALSNLDGSADQLMDLLSDVNGSVIAKEIAGGADEFCASASEALLHKGYDLVIGVTNDYIAADMKLNKYKDIRAAVCGSKQELYIANKLNPNVILLSGNIGLAKDIADIIGKPAPQQKQQQQKQQKPQKFVPQPKQVEEEPEEDEPPSKPSKAGVFGKLKDSLGIIDE